MFPIFWLTGNTGAGKTTLSTALERYVNHEMDPSVSSIARRLIVLDGDEMRSTISTNESLSKEDRRAHNLRVARLADLLKRKGFLIIVAVIAPFESVRQEIDAICSPQWIYIKREGLVNSEKPYEEPKNSDLVIDTDGMDETGCVKVLKDWIVTECAL